MRVKVSIDRGNIHGDYNAEKTDSLYGIWSLGEDLFLTTGSLKLYRMKGNVILAEEVHYDYLIIEVINDVQS